MPLYLRYLGAEAYGLVGFFSMVQVWFGLLDMGLSPSVARETARFRGGKVNALKFRQLLRAIGGIFFVIAITGFVSLYLAAGTMAEDWLEFKELSSDSVKSCLEIMAAVVAIRWLCGLYRGIITGAERLVWLSGFNIMFATLRFVLVIPILAFVASDPITFFTYQLLVSILELLGIYFYANRIKPKLLPEEKVGWNIGSIKPTIKFSLTLAFTSTVWVLITQIDKLILSKILPLADYGHYTLAVLAASGIMLISIPVGAALLPRMALLEAEGKHETLITLYRNSTQFVVVTAGAVSIIMTFFSKELLFIWLSDEALALKIAPILSLYSLGNGILVAAAFPYYLQYSKGDLRLHLFGNALFVVFLVPTIFWMTSNFGGVGAGWAWLSINLLSFVAWLPIVHHRLARSLNLKWYLNDILFIVAPMTVGACVLSQFSLSNIGRLEQFLFLIFYGFVVLLIGGISSSFIRSQFKYRSQNYLKIFFNS